MTRTYSYYELSKLKHRHGLFLDANNAIETCTIGYNLSGLKRTPGTNNLECGDVASGILYRTRCNIQ